MLIVGLEEVEWGVESLIVVLSWAKAMAGMSKLANAIVLIFMMNSGFSSYTMFLVYACKNTNL